MAARACVGPVARCGTGAAAGELDEVARRMRPRMRRLIRGLRVPDEDAEDLIQQTLMALLACWGEVRDPEAWIVGAVRKKCLMYWRGRRRRIYEAVDDALLEWLAEPESPAQERWVLESDLAQGMGRLPERYRSVLQLRFGLGYGPREVARRLGYQVSSIGKVTTRSLAALGRELDGAGFRKASCPGGIR